MTFGDLLDQVARSTDDTSGQMRAAALRWLNLARSEIETLGPWRSALDPVATLLTSAGTTSGIYTLSGYEGIAASTMWDETNSGPVREETLKALSDNDPQKQTLGQPTFWADAGRSTAGERQVYLWPIPDSAFTIRFAGYRLLADVSDENLSVDPYFGPILLWGATFSAGLRYYQQLDNNESDSATQRAYTIFMRLVAKRRGMEPLAPVGSFQTDPVKNPAQPMGLVGRLDPSRYPA